MFIAMKISKLLYRFVYDLPQIKFHMLNNIIIKLSMYINTFHKCMLEQM
jgi:hypothetical protein